MFVFDNIYFSLDIKSCFSIKFVMTGPEGDWNILLVFYPKKKPNNFNFKRDLCNSYVNV